jgi:membrane protein
VIDSGHEHPNILKRGFWKSTLWHLVLIAALPLAFLLSLMAAQWVRQESWLHFFADLKTVGPLVSIPFSSGVGVVALFLVYYFIPRSVVPPSQALRAALVAAPAIEITRYLFGRYAYHAVALHKIYGIFVVIPLFILWIDLLWLIVLSAALLIRFKPVRLYTPE